MFYRASQLTAIALAALFLAGCGNDDGARSDRAPVILATTTSTQDSGLLDVLIPAFERESGYQVKTIAIGSGEAIEMGARGEADVVLAHSPAAEEELMADGKGGERRTVMHNVEQLGTALDEKIKTFGVDEFGEPLFVPDAGKTDAQIVEAA